MDKKQVFDYRTHHKIPKIKFNKKRPRRTAYKGVVNQPEKAVKKVLPFKNL
jgi:hypothetical protein